MTIVSQGSHTGGQTFGASIIGLGSPLRGVADKAVEANDSEATLLKNQHFHEFDGAQRRCECGLSLADYRRQDDKEVCSVVLDALFDPLPTAPM